MAASRSRISAAGTMPTSATAAATRNAARYAFRSGTGRPATTCTAPTATITVVRTATPTAPDSCLAVLNSVEAALVKAGAQPDLDGAKLAEVIELTNEIRAKYAHGAVAG